MIRTDTHPPALVYWGLQPAALIFTYLAAAGVLAPLDFYSGIVIVFAALTIAEEVWSARRDWRQTGRERLAVLVMFVLSALAMALWQVAYPVLFQQTMPQVQAIAGPLWPSTLPMVVQSLIAFLALQLIAYWLHRFQHRTPWLWRGTGHGTHHTYTRLNAINWNSNHPLEAIFLVAAPAILALLFGPRDPILIGAALAIANAACAHLNVRVNDKGIGLIFTVNVHHVHHHSSDFRESNTNYGCAAIVWDRVFGTFEHADTARLGDFAEEPALARKLALPFKS